MKMTVKDIFSIKGRGAVLAGHLDEGEMHVGQKVVLKAKENSFMTKIDGIEINRQELQTVKAEEDLAILIRNIDLSLLSDGVTYTEEPNYIVDNLIVYEASNETEDEKNLENKIQSVSKWWQFWK
jgi:translation elongation factor EF-Tu-like GTPase